MRISRGDAGSQVTLTPSARLAFPRLTMSSWGGGQGGTGRKSGCEMTTTAVKFDRDEIRRALGILTSQGEVRELRSPKTGQGTISGYFNDSEKLAQAAASLSGNG